MKYRKLRKKYPRFVFKNYSWKVLGKDLKISFYFLIKSARALSEGGKIEPNIEFTPKIVIKNINKTQIKRVGERALNNLTFHLGLIELLSYWKVTCSPIIEIRTGLLNRKQTRWWKNLIINGMGQFFYENKINFRQPNFLKIKSNNITTNVTRKGNVTFGGVLVPMGGGKDSVVTLEILKKAGKKINCFSLNPTKAAQEVMKIGGFKKPIIVKRKIDKKLLELNRKGFLNGHTPFSAYLAFLTVLLALIFDRKFVAFSNERSSNEGNLKYLGKVINHQYSKSFSFEKKFRDYSKKYLAKDAEYFSFLRPLYEIQIAKLFSQYLQYFPAFLSCNVALQTNSGRKKPTGKWCSKCPKCLFVFVSLFPFVNTEKLIKIFGKNLFKDRKLLPLMLRLIGEKGFKPFECVGTKKESQIAFYLSWKKVKGVGEMPYLLSYFEKRILPQYENLEKDSKIKMNSWSKQNNLPKNFGRILKIKVIS